MLILAGVLRPNPLGPGHRSGCFGSLKAHHSALSRHRYNSTSSTLGVVRLPARCFQRGAPLTSRPRHQHCFTPARKLSSSGCAASRSQRPPSDGRPSDSDARSAGGYLKKGQQQANSKQPDEAEDEDEDGPADPQQALFQALNIEPEVPEQAPQADWPFSMTAGDEFEDEDAGIGASEPDAGPDAGPGSLNLTDDELDRLAKADEEAMMAQLREMVAARSRQQGSMPGAAAADADVDADIIPEQLDDAGADDDDDDGITDDEGSEEDEDMDDGLDDAFEDWLGDAGQLDADDPEFSEMFAGMMAGADDEQQDDQGFSAAGVDPSMMQAMSRFRPAASDQAGQQLDQMGSTLAGMMGDEDLAGGSSQAGSTGPALLSSLDDMEEIFTVPGSTGMGSSAGQRSSSPAGPARPQRREQLSGLQTPAAWAALTQQLKSAATIERLAALVEQRIADFNGAHVGIALARWVKLTKQLPLEQRLEWQSHELIPDLAELAGRMAGVLGPAQLSSTVRGLTQLECYPPHVLQQLLAAVARSSVRDYSPYHLSGLIWALGTLRSRGDAVPEELLPLMAQFLDAFVDWYGAPTYRLSGFTCVDISTIMFALVRIDQHHPGAFIQHAATRLVNGGLLAAAPLRDLTTIAYSCATLGCGPWDLMDALAREAQARVQQVLDEDLPPVEGEERISCRGVAYLVWAFGQCGYRNRAFLTTAVEAYFEDFKRLTPFESSRLLQGMAGMGYRNDPLIWDVLLHLAEDEDRRRACDAEVLATVLVALYDVGLNPGRWFLERWVLELDIKHGDLTWEMAGKCLLACAYFRYWDEALFEIWANYAGYFVHMWPPQALADMAAAFMCYPAAKPEYFTNLAGGVEQRVHEFSAAQLQQVLMAYSRVQQFPEALLAAARQLPLLELPQDVLVALLTAMGAAEVNDEQLVSDVAQALYVIVLCQVEAGEVLEEQLELVLAGQSQEEDEEGEAAATPAGGRPGAGSPSGQGRGRGGKGSRSRAASFADQVSSLQQEVEQETASKRLAAVAAAGGQQQRQQQQQQQQQQEEEAADEEWEPMEEAPPFINGGTTMLDMVRICAVLAKLGCSHRPLLELVAQQLSMYAAEPGAGREIVHEGTLLLTRLEQRAHMQPLLQQLERQSLEMLTGTGPRVPFMQGYSEGTDLWALAQEEPLKSILASWPQQSLELTEMARLMGMQDWAFVENQSYPSKDPSVREEQADDMTPASMDTSEVVELLWCLACQQQQHRPSPQLLQLCVDRLESELDQVSPLQLPMLASACGQLGLRDQAPLLLLMAKELSGRCAELDPADLADLVWGFAELSASPGALLREIADAARDKISRFQAAELARLAKGYAIFWLAKAFPKPPQQLMVQVCTAAVAKISSFQGCELVDLLWGLAQMGLAGEEVVQAVVEAAVPRVQELEGRELVLLVQVLAQLELCPEDLLGVVDLQLVSRWREQQQQQQQQQQGEEQQDAGAAQQQGQPLDADQLLRVLALYSQLLYLPQSLEGLVQEQLGQQLSSLHQASSEAQQQAAAAQLTAALQAFADLGSTPRQLLAVLEAQSAFTEALLQHLSPSQAASLLYSLAVFKAYDLPLMQQLAQQLPAQLQAAQAQAPLSGLTLLHCGAALAVITAEAGPKLELPAGIAQAAAVVLQQALAQPADPDVVNQVADLAADISSYSTVVHVPSGSPVVPAVDVVLQGCLSVSGQRLALQVLRESEEVLPDFSPSGLAQVGARLLAQRGWQVVHVSALAVTAAGPQTARGYVSQALISSGLLL